MTGSFRLALRRLPLVLSAVVIWLAALVALTMLVAHRVNPSRYAPFAFDQLVWIDFWWPIALALVVGAVLGAAVGGLMALLLRRPAARIICGAALLLSVGTASVLAVKWTLILGTLIQ